MSVPYIFANLAGPLPLSDLDYNFAAVEADIASLANGSTPMTTPVLGIPASGNLINCTNYSAANLVGTISNAQLAYSSVTINGSTIVLGSSTTVTANTTNAITFNNSGTGAASGQTFNGSTAYTISYNTLGASPLAGSASLTTVGTLTTGTWNASTIALLYGGTGATTASGARSNLGAAASGTNSDITSLTGLTTPLSIAQGGLGLTTLTANAVMIGNGTSTPTFVAPGANGNSLRSNGTNWVSTASSNITSATAQASTSGTSIDFTSIPSWVKRITVMFSGVSGSGTSNFMIQVGSGSVTTTGYLGQVSEGSSNVYFSSGFVLRVTNIAANTSNGIVILSLLNANTWTEFGNISTSATNSIGVSAGSIALSGALDRVRITTVNGTDTFDAGSINILYE